MKKTIFAVSVACVLGSVPVAASRRNQVVASDKAPMLSANVAQASFLQRVGTPCRQLRRRSAAKLASVDPSVTPKPGVASADVLARTPKGARTLGFATAALGTGGAPVLLHFHAVPGKPVPGAISQSCDNIQLDVYSRLRNGGLKHLRSFACSDDVEQGGKILFDSVRLLWLQPRLKRGPILRLSHSELFVLPQGWGGPLKTLDLYSHQHGAGTINFFTDSTDSRGYARVRVDDSSAGLDVVTGPNGGSADAASSYLYWNGQDFVPNKSGH